jgi:PAS domain-containing protein
VNNLDYYLRMIDHPLTSIVGIITINILMLAVAWFKFKTALVVHTAEIKHHSDVAVQKLNGMLTYVINSFDRPAWVKVAHQTKDKVEFRMLEVNQKYTDIFGHERMDYLGKTDLEVGWSKEHADAYHAHDLQVWATGEPQTFYQEYNGKILRFRKLRVISSDGKTKGVMGYQIDCSHPDGCPHRELPDCELKDS